MLECDVRSNVCCENNKYPPEGVDDAMDTVMKQCELWADTKIEE